MTEPASLRIRFEDFEVSWAGPNPYRGGFCFGAEDGRLLFTDEDGKNIYGEAAKGSLSGEAVNGVARAGRYLAVSTREDITFWHFPESGNERPSGSILPYGAHDIMTVGDYFVASLGRIGMMSVRPDAVDKNPVTMTRSSREGFVFYRTISLLPSASGNWLVCAGRSGGIGVSEFWGEKEGSYNMSTVTFDGLDVVDVCSVGSGANPSAVAGLGRDGTLIFIRDAMNDREPVTIKFDSVEGTAYRLMCAGRDLFLLTSRGMYALVDLSGRFIGGEPMDSFTTPILTVPLEAVDANLCGDKWLLTVMPDGVRRYAITPLRTAPAPIQRTESKESRATRLLPRWRRVDQTRNVAAIA